MGSALSGLFCSSRHVPILHFSSCPVDVPVNKSDEPDAVENIDIPALVHSICPSLKLPYNPPWWLRNGHLQTGYCVIGDFSNVDQIVYHRKLLRTADGGTLGLDFTPSDDDNLRDDAPILVVLHGLTGGSHESYVRAILAPACASLSEGGLGYRGVVLNFRGCAGVPLTSPQLYSAGHTEDLRVALMYIAHTYPNASLLGIGFSMGANVLTRYLAEEGNQSRLIAGCALACPWNIAHNAAQIEGTWFNRAVYSKAMAGNLMIMLKRNVAALSKFTDHPISHAVKDALSLDAPYMFQFDNLITRIIGGCEPHFPFATQFEYYQWSRSDCVLPSIRVPYLAINAYDDPLVQECPQHSAGNGWVTLAFTERGGHLGWFEASKKGQMKRWITKPVLEWSKGLVERLSLDEHGNIKGRQCRPYREVDGFLKEVGREEYGCREITSVNSHIVDFKNDGRLLQGL